jgi:hypothetical protein
MAEHKNQHYTPRCLLKPFTLNGGGRAINLYAIKANKLIPGAPAKTQCARSYLYDEGGALEAALAKLEGDYSNALRRLVNDEYVEDDLNTFRFFAHLQARRTEMAAQRLAALAEETFADMPDAPPMSLRYHMLQSLDACFHTEDRLQGLKTRIIENRSRVDFIIADDPAVFTNRFTEQRLNKPSYGLHSAGLIITMPLTPKLAVMSYDNGVYTVSGLERGRIVIKRDADAILMNELQFINASSTFYFQNWDDRNDYLARFKSVSERRLNKRFRVTYAVLDRESPDGSKRYKVVPKNEAKAPGTSLMHQEMMYPVPSAWLSSLQYRRPPKTFSNGTGIGHVRRQEWLRST